MTPGSVTVVSDGTYTGTGLAKALMDAHVGTAEALMASQLAASQITASASNEASMKLALRQGLAALANAYGQAIVTYLQANATAHVTTQVLARTPSANPVPSNTDVEPPAAPVDIPIT